MAAVPSTTAASQRGAERANSGVKRTPRLMPMNNWAALVSGTGRADSCTSASVSTMVTSNAPMNHGLALPSARMAKAPAPVSMNSTSMPVGSTSRDTVAALASSPCTPHSTMAKGRMTVTISTRRLWALATRSVRAPWRSAISVISEAPPMAPAK